MVNRIVVVAGPSKGKVFSLTEPATIGRHLDNTIQLDERQVSRKHACIEQTGAGMVVRDLGSGNGTYIGDRRILEYRLHDGDIIRIGSSQLRFEGEGAAPEPSTSPKPPGNVQFESHLDLTVTVARAEQVYETLFATASTSNSPQELRDAQGRLSALYRANQIISQERNLERLFERVIDQIFTLVKAHNGAILLLDPASG